MRGLLLSSLLALSSASAQASGVPDCIPLSSPFKSIEEQARAAQNAVEFWSITPKDVQQSACLRKNPLTDAEVESEIAKLNPPGDRKVSKNLFGISIENESEALVGLLESLLKTDSASPAYIAQKAKPAPSQPSFNTMCKTVLCAVKDPTVFGPKLGPRLLYMLGKYGFNGSQYASRSADKWSDDELDEVVLALTDYPPAALPVHKNYPLTHFARGFIEGPSGWSPIKPEGDDKKILATSRIHLYDKWNDKDPEIRRSTVVHEIGHVISNEFDIDESPQWLKFSGWQKRTRIKNGKPEEEWKATRPDTLASEYAEKNPKEDFAESVEAYRYNPNGLKKKSPGKYDFLKDTVFDGIEFTSESSCSDPSRAHSARIAKSLSEKAAEELARPGNIASKIKKGALRDCDGEGLPEAFTESGIFHTERLATRGGCAFKTLFGSSTPRTPSQDPLASRVAQARSSNYPLPTSVQSRLARELKAHYGAILSEYVVAVMKPYGSSLVSLGSSSRVPPLCDRTFAKSGPKSFPKVATSILMNRSSAYPQNFEPIERFGSLICQEVIRAHGDRSEPLTEAEIRVVAERKIQ